MSDYGEQNQFLPEAGFVIPNHKSSLPTHTMQNATVKQSTSIVSVIQPIPIKYNETPPLFIDYFSSIAKLPTRQVPFQMQVNERLGMQIQEGKLEIRKKKSKFAAKQSKDQKEKQPDTEAKINALRSQREEVIERLKEIYKKQVELVKSKVKSNHHLPAFKPITEDQKKILSKAILSHRSLKSSISQKTPLLLSSIHDEQIKLQHQNEEQKQKSKQKRSNQAQQRLKKLEERRRKQRQMWQEAKITQADIRKRKYVHIQNVQKQKLMKEEIERQRAQKLKKMRQMLKSDLVSTIKQHQKRYQHILQTRTPRRSLSHSSLSNISDNYFRRVVKQRISQQKQEERQNYLEAKARMQKIKEYRQYVLQRFKPTIKQRQKIQDQKSKSSINILSYVETRNKGKQYLTHSKKLISHNPKAPEPVVPIAPYPNYLSQSSHAIKSNKEKFQELVKQDLDNQKIEKAKLLVQKLGDEWKKQKDGKLVSSVKRKMILLDAIMKA